MIFIASGECLRRALSREKEKMWVTTGLSSWEIMPRHPAFLILMYSHDLGVIS
jgi:hypothetical protein